jgi:subtilisin family serine protease
MRRFNRQLPIVYGFLPIAICLFAGVRPVRAEPAAEQLAQNSRPTGRWWVSLEEPRLSPSELDRALDEAARGLTPRSLQRRSKVIHRDPPMRLCDLPPNPEIIAAIEAAGFRVKVAARYINAVSVIGDEQRLARLIDLPGVKTVRPVMAFTDLEGGLSVRSTPEHIEQIPSSPADASLAIERTKSPPSKGLTTGQIERTKSPPSKGQMAADAEDYGLAWRQTALVNIPAAHSAGWRGHGVLVGLQDTGFNNLDHTCFSHLQIVAAYDFLNGDDNVGDEGDLGSGVHGTRTLSVIAGMDSGRFIGAAPDAQYVLTKTENTESESRVEEDLWVAGLWFHDSVGTEVLSSSLSYRNWYDYEDLDGETAVTTRAADSAAAAGMVIVNSMGNTGLSAYPFTKLGAPADGDLVIAVGGVSRDSSHWSNASQGPTYDGRIKPDVVAQSVWVYAASALNDTGYSAHNGTSYSCPMAAGIAALMLEANPDLTPAEVMEILHRTSSRADDPDTLVGWGIPDAMLAIQEALEVGNSVLSLIPHPSSLLLSTFPNPFNGVATIAYQLPRPGAAEVAVYDALGRKVALVASGWQTAGRHFARWESAGIASGAYLARLTTEGETITRSVISIR